MIIRMMDAIMKTTSKYGHVIILYGKIIQIAGMQYQATNQSMVLQCIFMLCIRMFLKPQRFNEKKLIQHVHVQPPSQYNSLQQCRNYINVNLPILVYCYLMRNIGKYQVIRKFDYKFNITLHIHLFNTLMCILGKKFHYT